MNSANATTTIPAHPLRLPVSRPARWPPRARAVARRDWRVTPGPSRNDRPRARALRAATAGECGRAARRAEDDRDRWRRHRRRRRPWPCARPAQRGRERHGTARPTTRSPRMGPVGPIADLGRAVESSNPTGCAVPTAATTFPRHGPLFTVNCSPQSSGLSPNCRSEILRPDRPAPGRGYGSPSAWRYVGLRERPSRKNHPVAFTTTIISRSKSATITTSSRSKSWAMMCAPGRSLTRRNARRGRAPGRWVDRANEKGRWRRGCGASNSTFATVHLPVRGCSGRHQFARAVVRITSLRRRWLPTPSSRYRRCAGRSLRRSWWAAARPRGP